MIKFGTGGWRAIIADGFTKENIRLLTAGLCKLMEREGLSGARICLGYDRRFLSKESMFWAAEVLAGYGFRPFVINRSAPTPLIMFTVKNWGLHYGMAITASHNPAIYNGIKIFTDGGRDAEASVTKKIEAEISRLTPADVKSIPYEQALEAGIIREGYPFNEYIDSILNFVDVQKIKESRLRIAIDPMYGVSNNSLRTILLTCRCDVDVIREQHDTLFGGRMPAPSAEAQRLLSVYVTDHHCDLGIATDGDADRLGVIDENGGYLVPEGYDSRLIDVLTGETAISVRAYGREFNMIIATYGANIGANFMIGESNITGRQLVTGISQGVSNFIQGEGRMMMGAASIATGNVASGVAQIGAGFSAFGNCATNLIDAFTPINNTVGGLSSAAAAKQPLTLDCWTVSHRVVGGRDGASQFFGTPTMMYKSLNNISGYVECENATVDVPAIGCVRDLINTALNRGIYIE